MEVCCTVAGDRVVDDGGQCESTAPRECVATGCHDVTLISCRHQFVEIGRQFVGKPRNRISVCQVLKILEGFTQCRQAGRIVVRLASGTQREQGVHFF